MKIITKISIGAGAVAPVIGGLGWYFSNKGESKINTDQKSNIKITTPRPSFSKFWGGRIKILEKELVRLNKLGKGQEITLAEQIDPQYGRIFFALMPDGNGLRPDPTFQQSSLDKFCRNPNNGRIDNSLYKQLCENIDYEHFS